MNFMKEKGRFKAFIKAKSDVITVLCVILVMTLVAAFGLFDNLESRVFDALMKIKPATTEREDVAIIAIDDASIAELGEYPWPRNIITDTLIRMRELGAVSATFDIEYLQPSAQGVNQSNRTQIPDRFAEAENAVGETVYSIVQAVGDGDLPAEYIYDYAEYFIDTAVEPVYNLGVWSEGSLFRDNDAYLAQGLHFFGNSWITYNISDIGIYQPDEEIEYCKNNLLINNMTDAGNYIPGETDDYAKANNYKIMLVPAMDSLLYASQGAGFTNIVLDGDGVRRRVKLVFPYEDKYVPQLVFAPMLKILNPESIERTKYKLILHNCHKDGEPVHDITIPLDDDGNMLVNWIRDGFANSFQNVPVIGFHTLDIIEENLVTALKEFKKDGRRVRSLEGYALSYSNLSDRLIEDYEYITQFKEYLLEKMDGDSRFDEEYDIYFETRRQFFEDCHTLCEGDVPQELFDTLQERYELGGLDESGYESYMDVFERIFFEIQKNLYDYEELYTQLQEKLDGAFCIVGHTASASTDLGQTPFEGHYANVGTHANVYNTIMSEEFITPLPWWFGIVIASLLILIATFLGRKLKTAGANVTLIVANLGLLALFVLPMVLWSVYIQLFTPMLLSIISSLGLVILRFMASEKDKSFLRSTFSTYVSGDVVDEIMKNPAMLKLGGDVFNCTAIFTDIRSFSTISERVDAAFLVEILNEYLTLLSDVILEKKGTIDKYEGDAIIGFWGAPMPVEHNAYQACVAAIRMKAAEAKFNEQMIEDGRIFLKGVPKIGPNGEEKVLNRIVLPLATRIGLNTGEMVVGNMGTDNKKNYTMMGTNVNLAARLEGVNKAYQTWICVSEFTWKAANEGECEGRLLARKLDRVLVIGIKDPVQLFNVVGLKEECSKEQIESVEVFNAAMDKYFARDFEGAKVMFRQAFDIWPERVYQSILDPEANVFNNELRDYSPCLEFINRCDEYITNGCPDDWVGVYTMKSK